MITKEEFEKAVEYCTSEGFCSNCLLIRKPLRCGIYLAEYIKENEPAPSANGTSSEVSQSDTKKILAHLDDSTKKAICQAFVQAQGAAAHILEIYERMSESEQRAFDLGEVYRELSGAMDELEDIKGGEKND